MKAACMRSTIMAGSALLPAVCWTLAVCLLLSAAGCSKPAGKKVKKDAVDGVAVEEEGEPLPEGVDLDTALAVDEGRIRVCGPTGWSRAAQSKDYLVKYIPGRRKTYPSIVVMAVAAPDGFTEVGADEHRLGGVQPVPGDRLLDGQPHRAAAKLPHASHAGRFQGACRDDGRQLLDFDERSPRPVRPRTNLGGCGAGDDPAGAASHMKPRAVHYDKQRIYVRHVMTHAEYDQNDWRKK